MEEESGSQDPSAGDETPSGTAVPESRRDGTGRRDAGRDGTERIRPVRGTGARGDRGATAECSHPLSIIKILGLQLLATARDWRLLSCRQGGPPPSTIPLVEGGLSPPSGVAGRPANTWSSCGRTHCCYRVPWYTARRQAHRRVSRPGGEGC